MIEFFELRLYEAYRINAELMKFFWDMVMPRIKANHAGKNILKDLAIDCSHISDEIRNDQLIKKFIRIDLLGYTEAIDIIEKNGKLYKNGFAYPSVTNKKDSIWITCIEFKPNCGHGCKWIELTPEEIIEQIEGIQRYQ